jgi:teichuronic acid biosynthesis glycosyltransferase TuaG
MNKTIHISEHKSFSELMKNTDIGTLTVMIDLEKVNIPKIPLRKMSWDFLMWAEILKSGIIAYGYPEVLGHYRIVSNSVSRNKKKSALGVYSIMKEDLNLGFFRRNYYFLGYAFNSIKRYCFKK